MSILDRLNQTAPRDDKRVNLSRGHSPIFAETAERYLEHSSGNPVTRDGLDVAFLHMLATKLMLREEAAMGALARAQQVDDAEEARLYQRHAGKHAQFALVFAFAIQKADQTARADLETFITRIIENVRSSFDGHEPVDRMVSVLLGARQRGWQMVPPGVAVPIISGANWCPDTASLAETTNALAVPVALMFFEYIQLAEEKGRRKHGIFMVQDHAQAVYEDGFEKPKIPVVRYPNGATHFEPDLFQYVEQLVENGFI
jgi:hypothetical protein